MIFKCLIPHTERQNTIVLLILLVLTISMVAACTRRDQLSPFEQLRAIFESDPSCVAPCWHGITPGKSTESDFLAAVSTSKHHFADLRRNEFGSGGIRFIWRDRPADLLVYSDIHSDTISFISFQSDHDLKPSAVLELLGMPSTYLAYFSAGEIPVVILYLFYENQGIVLETTTPISSSPPQCIFSLTDAADINEIFLVGSGPSTEVLESLPRFFPPTIEGTQPWENANNIELSLCAR